MCLYLYVIYLRSSLILRVPCTLPGITGSNQTIWVPTGSCVVTLLSADECTLVLGPWFWVTFVQKSVKTNKFRGL
jgi:hypothetical protein